MDEKEMSPSARRWADLPLRAKGLVVVAIPLLALILTTTAFLLTWMQDKEAERLVRHTYEVRLEMQATLAAIVTAESNVRGYRLSRRADFLPPYHESRDSFPRHIQKLRELVGDNPGQLNRVASVEKLVRQRGKSFDEILNTPFPTVNTILFPPKRLLNGKQIMDNIHAEFATMQGVEDGLLQNRVEAMEAMRTRASAAVWGGLLLGITGGICATWLFASGVAHRVQDLERNAGRLAQGLPLEPFEIDRDEIGQLEAALHATSQLLVERQSRLERIMDNSLDIICTIDEGGHFTTVSAASEKVWGYRPQELVGRLYADLLCPEDLQRSNVAAASVIAGSPVRDFENRYVHRDGRLVPMTWSARWSVADMSMFCVARDDSERKAAENDLIRLHAALHAAKEAAENANQAKSEFLSRMSHELRTPLNAILGFAQILEMETPRPDQRESVNQILKGGRHLLDLINEVLDIARIEAGRMDLSPEPVHLSEVLRETADMVRPLANERNVEFNLVGTCSRHVTADRQRLKQVFLNLFSNAVKYNREGGSVSVRCESVDGEKLRVNVIDTGLGIPQSDLARIFTPFERLSAGQSNIEGTGLGLALSKGLVEAMNGTLGADSVVGRGSTLWVELPLVEAPVDRHDRMGPAVSPNSLDQAGLGGGKTILYIEDNLSNLRLIERLLKRQTGVELLSAMQGRLGLELAIKHVPNLILLDLHLPDIPGDEVLRRLKAEPETCDIPVIMLSADASPGQIERLTTLGTVAYLTKPLDVPRFLEVVAKSL